MQREWKHKTLTIAFIFAILGALTVAPSSHSGLRRVESKGPEPSAATQNTQIDVPEEKVEPYVGAVNGEAFVLKERGDRIQTTSLKTSLPVFKALGLSNDQKSLLYRPLRDGKPSGELYVENLNSNSLELVSNRLVLAAAWSPGSDSKIAYTFSTGNDFGLAIKDLISGGEKIIAASGVLADFVQWDPSGKGIYYFEASTEYTYTRLTPRFNSIKGTRGALVANSNIPAGFPTLRGKVDARKLSQLSATGEPIHPPDLYAFEVSSSDGQYRIEGDNLLSSSELFARNKSGSRTHIGEGVVQKVLRKGVVIKNFSAGGSSLNYVGWGGHSTLLATTSTVNYNLPLKNSTLTQGGVGYASPGNCNLVSHTGSPHSFAYDFRGAIGEHALASADGLVVRTVSNVTCNTLDTDCVDFVPNCNQGTYLGNVVIIEHADGTFTNYAHLDKSSVQVAVGTSVCQGFFVARQGHTGSTQGTFNGCGDHLHFQRQTSSDVFGESIEVTFADVPSNPLSCGASLTSASNESSYNVTPANQSFSSAASSGTIDVTAVGAASCSWAAISNDAFITILSGNSGSGNGIVGYSVADNPTSSVRVGTMTITGKTVTITQYGVGYTNQPPIADAGANQAIALPASASLNGTVTDDGLPNPPGAVTVTWSTVAGPGSVSFSNVNALNTTASFSTAGQYVLRLTANDGALSGTDDLIVSVNPAGTQGSLAGNLSTPSSLVDLTAEGSLDWAHWGRSNATSFNHRSGVAQQISNFTTIGGASVQSFNDNAVGYSWTNGTPTASETNTIAGVWVGGINNGFQITVPADTTLKTLRLYVGVAAAQGRLTATLSDGSAPAFIDTALSSSGSANGVYTINFQAAASGQQLVLTWTSFTLFAPWGNVTFQAASLSGGVPANQAPVVNAGADQNITLPSGANLAGSATDDGLPNGSLSVLWSVVSGPGTVTFNNPNQTVTSATFSAPGAYVLQLTANDSQLSAGDQMTVVVSGAANQAPVVNAGPDQTITLPANATLNGTASDDGLPNPPAALTTTWSQVSGPGTVTFGNVHALNTSAGFSVAGQYVLRLTANDGALSNIDDVTITVNSAATGSLTGTLGTTGTPVNLTTEGSLDWAHWGRTNAASFNHRSGVTQQISNYTRIGTQTPQWFNDNAVGYTWTNGTPTVSTTNTTTGLWVGGINNGFQITVPADTTVKTLRLYVGVAAAQGRLTATLSDNSAPVYTNTGLSSSGSAVGVYTINFQALSSGQQLVVKWTVAATFISWGNVTFQAASLANAGGPPNQPPVVNAGADQNITLPNGVNLAGSATDDGLPNGSLSVLWSVVSGPGTVTFNNASQAVTSATFSAPGTYVLQLTANDSQLSASDQMTVIVNPGNQAPVVNAGPDQTIILPASSTLNGTVTDDGLPNPPAALTTTWSQVSGPGTVTFGNVNAVNTTASFSVAGQYVLRLTANDGALSNIDDVTITANTTVTGSLAGSLATPATPVNLTTEGLLDWAHWGRTNVTSFNHRSTVTQQISNYTRIGTNVVQWFNDNTVGYTWTDGTPTVSATNTTTGLWVGGVNNGFQIIVPADTTLKTLRLYVGVAAAQGRLTATLSDNSAPAYTNTGLSSSGSANGVYTINFQAASSGQQLVVKWTTAATFISWGNVTFQAASLR